VDLLAADGIDPFAGPRGPRAAAHGQTTPRPDPAGAADAGARSALNCPNRCGSSPYALIRDA